jgi:hypothetical protein
MREMYRTLGNKKYIHNFGLNISGEETITKISEDNIKIYLLSYGLSCEEMNWIEPMSRGSGVEGL